MNFKIKVGVLILFTVIVYIFGISVINSSINDLKDKRSSIESINRNVSILISLSNRAYSLDDKISSNIIQDKNFDKEVDQMDVFNDGIFIFSEGENHKLDSLINLKLENLRVYKEDTLYCYKLDYYYSKNQLINSEIRRNLKDSISKSLGDNNKKLKEILDDYDNSYFKYVIVGSVLVVLFTIFAILLVLDFARLVKSNNRTRSTIEDLFRYIKSKK